MRVTYPESYHSGRELEFKSDCLSVCLSPLALEDKGSRSRGGIPMAMSTSGASFSEIDFIHQGPRRVI